MQSMLTLAPVQHLQRQYDDDGYSHSHIFSTDCFCNWSHVL